MTAGQLAAGLAVVVPVAASTVVSGVALRRLVLPRWSGEVATLAATVLGLSALLTLGHLLGLAGQLRAVPVVAGSVIVAAATALAARARAAEAADDGPLVEVERGDPVDPLVRVAATVLVAVLVAMWGYGLAYSLRFGMTSYDSLDYHLPIAARFVQTGEIAPLHFILPDAGTFTFHPADSELLNAIGMLGWHRDPLVPYLNIGWLAALLLAAWCVARTRGAAVLSLMATVLVLSVPIFARGQAGSALNDLPAMFGLVAAVALLVHGRDNPRAYAVAGLAAGIGLGTKLTVIFPVAMLTLCVPFLHRRRLAMSAAWAGGLMLTGSFWFVRNLVATGSPLPAAKLPGLPHAEMALLDQLGWTTGHYLLDTSVYRRVFLFGLRFAFGSLWPALAVAVVVALVVAFRRGGAVEKVVAIAAVTTLLGYFVTPTTALGAEGDPNKVIFAFNLRYAAPGVLLALQLGAADSARWSRQLRRAVALCALVVVLGAQSRFVWRPADAVVVAVAVVAGIAVLATIRFPALARPRVVLPATLAGVLALICVHGKWRDARAGDEPLAAWAEHITGSRIAMAGVREHYPLLGPELDNEVEYVGRRLEHGTFARVLDCPTWRRALNDGDFDYVVTFDSFPGDIKPDSWTDAPGATVEVSDDTLRIWRLDGPLDPAGCP